MEPIVVTQTFSVSKEVLWKAITEKKQMVRWFFENIPDFTPEVGFSTQFPVSSGERTFTHLWKITHVATGKEITYDWSYEEYTGQGIVTFSIDEMDLGSRLTVSFLGMEGFDANIPEFRRESCLGGWNYFIKERLADYLNL